MLEKHGETELMFALCERECSLTRILKGCWEANNRGPYCFVVYYACPMNTTHLQGEPGEQGGVEQTSTGWSRSRHQLLGVAAMSSQGESKEEDEFPLPPPPQNREIPLQSHYCVAKNLLYPVFRSHIYRKSMIDYDLAGPQ